MINSFDRFHVKGTDSDLFPDWLKNNTPKLSLFRLAVFFAKLQMFINRYVG